MKMAHWRYICHAPDLSKITRMLPRILVAEDDVINQKLIGLLFQRTGIVPVIVGDGLQAFEAACSQPFDMIFMDMMMPEMDGMTAAKQILSSTTAWPPPVIVAMTAGLDNQQQYRFQEAGIKDTLMKPFTAQSLKDILEKWGHLLS
jgi:CheY-like chemotaxis protein